MQVEKRTLNWLPRDSAWDEARAQREKRRAQNAEFLERQTVLASAFQATRDNLTFGLAELSGKAAAARVGATPTAVVDRTA